MIGDEIFLLFEWPRGRLRRWLAAFGMVAALMLVLYLVFSWLGW